jgi:hypothetical protein
MRTYLAGIKPIPRGDQFQHKAVALPVLQLLRGGGPTDTDICWWWPFEACALTGSFRKFDR